MGGLLDKKSVLLLALAAAAAALVGVVIVLVAFAPFPPAGFGERHEDRVFTDCADCPEMMPIDAGSFRMGEERRRLRFVLARLGLVGSDRRRVTIAYTFAVSRYEITFDQWEACVADGGCGGYTPPDEGWGRGSRPVIHVSWLDAQAYARWLSQKTGERYRLLSEAEWEYVARGGADSSFPWGWWASHDRANYGAPECPPCTGMVRGADQWLNTAPVGSFSPNQFGVFDMSGNVYEWVEDCTSTPGPQPTDGSPATASQPCEARWIRGGAWYSDPNRIRSNYRAYNTEDRRDYVIGFRVAREVAGARSG